LKAAAACYAGSQAAWREAKAYKESAGVNRRAEQNHTEKENEAISGAKHYSKLLEPHLTAGEKKACKCPTDRACRNARTNIRKKISEMEQERNKQANLSSIHRANRNWDVKNYRFCLAMTFESGGIGDQNKRIAAMYDKEDPTHASCPREHSHSVHDANHFLDHLTKVQRALRKHVTFFSRYHPDVPRHDHRKYCEDIQESEKMATA